MDTSGGCYVCRSRKVRCDRTPDSCVNCSKLGVQCPGYGNVQDNVPRKELARSVARLFEAAGVNKRRFGACMECHRIKARCTQRQPACARCVRKRLACIYPNAPSSSSGSRGPSPPDAPSWSPIEQTTESARTGQATTPVPLAHALLASPLTQIDAPVLPTMPVHASRNSGTASRAADASTPFHDSDTAWIVDENLPADPSRLGLLLRVYFDRVHHIRCLGFLHKPTLMRSFHQGRLFQDYGAPLVHILCALGVRVYYYDNIARLGHIPGHAPGAAWAQKARKDAMDAIVCPTTTTLMTLILICEFAIRADEHAAAFILIGCSYRVMRLLRLDSPQRYVPTTHVAATGPQTSSTNRTQRESELRLVWACYILDSHIGSGIDSNLQWVDGMPQVPLPASEANFLSQTHGHVDDASGQAMTDARCEVQANIISLAQLRTKVLRLIRRNTTAIPVWQRGSEFLDLLAELELWYHALPASLLPSQLNMFIQNETHTLGAMVGLHLAYHSAVTDLTRVALAGFDFPLAAQFRDAPALFRRRCQERCRHHADAVAHLVRQGCTIGPEAFEDSQCAQATFESTKVQIVHTVTASMVPMAHERLRADAVANIRSNLRLLATMHGSNHEHNPYLRALFPLLTRFSFHEITAEWPHMDMPFRPEDAEVTGPPDAFYLGKVASFRMATSAVTSDKNTPEQPGQDAHILTLPDVVEQPPIVFGMDDGGISAANMAVLGGMGDVGNALGSSGSAAAAATKSATTSTPFTGMDDTEALSLITDEMIVEHIRLAEEMSSYITWDVGEL